MKTEPVFFIVKRGSLTQPSKVDLRKAGVVVVEVESMADYVMKRGPALEMQTTQLLHAAVSSMASHASATTTGQLITAAGLIKGDFINKLAKILEPKQ